VEFGFLGCLQGKLNDGREIAVKKLSQSSNQGKKEFMNEAKLLARVQHRNVVNLVGYCVHGNEKLLVYEYVAHESLDKFLFSECFFNAHSLLHHSSNHHFLIFLVVYVIHYLQKTKTDLNLVIQSEETLCAQRNSRRDLDFSVFICLIHRISLKELIECLP